MKNIGMMLVLGVALLASATADAAAPKVPPPHLDANFRLVNPQSFSIVATTAGSAASVDFQLSCDNRTAVGIPGIHADDFPSVAQELKVQRRFARSFTFPQVKTGKLVCKISLHIQAAKPGATLAYTAHWHRYGNQASGPSELQTAPTPGIHSLYTRPYLL